MNRSGLPKSCNRQGALRSAEADTRSQYPLQGGWLPSGCSFNLIITDRTRKMTGLTDRGSVSEKLLCETTEALSYGEQFAS